MKQSSNIAIGNLIIFGSGETLPVGRKIQRQFFQALPEKQRVVILETPAGFQPNSEQVAKEVADVFRTSLGEFVLEALTIPARKKGTAYSPDNQQILQPLQNADYIFLGPGSPTYALSQLKDSKALDLIVSQWKNGATLSLSSAAALAFGEFTLPVYEIYKVGSELFWEKGLDLLRSVGLEFTVMTHWNNNEGGKDLDTSCCYMGKDRFAKLRNILPQNHSFLCIDEHTAIIFDFKNNLFWIAGKGVVTLLQKDKHVVFKTNYQYDLQSIRRVSLMGERKFIRKATLVRRSALRKEVKVNSLPQDVLILLEKREKARVKDDFQEADKLRNTLKKKGYIVEDSNSEQKIFTAS